ncbi:MAG: hypothetical protein JXA97_08460 [Anaerolineales bacterium]|nr:hypothetical protein [Anaerolineales bacterium]
MQSYIHEKKAVLKGNLGKFAIFAGLALLGYGFYISLKRDASTVSLLIILASVGTVITQVGSILFAKYGQKPRPDQVLDESLKGLSSSHALFHYALNTDHALLGPAGAVAVIAYQVNGTVIYEKDGYYVRGGGGLFGGGRKKKLRGIEKTVMREARELDKVLRWAFPDRDDIEVQPLVIFVNENVKVEADSAPIQSAHAQKAKNAFKRLPRKAGFSQEEIEAIAVKRGFIGND